MGMATDGGVGRGADGSYEGEIDQGGDETGESAGDLSGGLDLDSSGDKGVIGEESGLGLREGLLMLEVKGNTDLVEFSDPIAQMEREEVSHR